MVGGPIIARELLVQARKKSLYGGRMAAALVGFILLGLLLLEPSSGNPAAYGRALFSTLSWIAFVYCALIGVYLTADCLSSEKREGTLRLLFLTHLKPWHVLTGKLVSSSMVVVYGIIGLIPLLGITSLFGGVTQQHLIETALVLGNTLFLSLSFGMLVSTLCENDRKALFFGFLLLGLYFAAPYAVSYGTATARRATVVLNQAVLTSSPLYAFQLTQIPPPRAIPQSVLFQSLLFTHATAWLLLLLSAALVQRSSRDRIRVSRKPLPQTSESSSTTMACSSASRRERLLDENPITWLCLQTPLKVISAWIFLGSLTLIGWYLYFFYRLAFFEAALLLSGTAFVLIKVWFTSEICQTWVTDKNNGAFELLLSTPLRTATLAAGQASALLKQFGGPIILGIVLTLLSATLLTSIPIDQTTRSIGRIWLLITIPLLIADLAALRWVALWNSLTKQTLNRALFSSVSQIFLWRWLLFLLFLLFFRDYTYGDQNSSWSWLGFLLLFGVAIDLMVGLIARHRYLTFFRAIASNPRDWKSIVADPSNAERATGLDSKRQRMFRTDVRPLVIRAALMALVIYGVGRLWLTYQIERRIKELQSLAQTATPPATSSSITAQNPNNPARALTALAREIRPAQGSPTSLAAANETVLNKLHEMPSLLLPTYTSPPGSTIWRDEMEAFRQITTLLEGDVLLNAKSVLNLPAAVQSLRGLAQLCTVRDARPAVWMRGGLQIDAFDHFFNVAPAVLRFTALTAEQLKELQNILSSLQSRPRIIHQVKSWLDRSISQYRGTWVDAPMWMPPGRPVKPLDLIQQRIASTFASLVGIRQWQFHQRLEEFQELLRMAALPSPNRLAASSAFEALHPPRILPNGIQVEGAARTFHHLVVLEAITQSKVDLLRTAVAVELFRLDRLHSQGPATRNSPDEYHDPNAADRLRLPRSLRDLIPRFLPAMPEDPFTGGALRYGGVRGGYKLYVLPSLTTPNPYLSPSSAQFDGTLEVRF